MLTMDDSNSTPNSTFSPISEDESYRRNLKKINDILAILALCTIMLAMGTDILWKQIWEHLRRPIAVVIGMISQFVVMPLLGFALLNTMSVSPAYAISVLLMSCCPGGAVSNIFAYFLDGDVPLSVTMTTLSTLVALGLMPFNLWFYGMWIDTGKLVIPYKSMAITLVYVTSPACLGILIRWKFPNVAVWITKILSIVGFIIITASITLQNLAYPDMLIDIPWALYMAAVVMPTVGFILGFGLAWICKRSIRIRKTIAVESGVQNAAVAIGVISVSPIPFDLQKPLLTFPMMYAISMIVLCFLLCSSYNLYNKMCKKENNDKIQEITFGDNVIKTKIMPVDTISYKSCDIPTSK